jgi:hypothetical protein
MQRQEIRTWLRSLPIGERIKHAASDPQVAAAVVFSPPALSGLNDDGHGRAKEFLTQHLFGAELDALDAEASELAEVTAAITIAERELNNEIHPPSKEAQIKLKRDDDGNVVMGDDGKPVYVRDDGSDSEAA